jgi:hypothetical protein
MHFLCLECLSALLLHHTAASDFLFFNFQLRRRKLFNLLRAALKYFHFYLAGGVNKFIEFTPMISIKRCGGQPGIF